VILIDTETTGLIQPGAVPLSQQPHIIEFAAIKLDDKSLEEVDNAHFLCKPPVLLPEIITKITGLTDADLEDQLPFPAHLPAVLPFFCGEVTLVAHNLPFDRGMVTLELQRLDRVSRFPWPYLHRCTVELTMDIKGHRLKQEQLYEMATGQPAGQTHRALDDVRQLAEVVRWLREEGRI
jgi:DNA polymerase III epsilon subunit-like protein